MSSFAIALGVNIDTADSAAWTDDWCEANHEQTPSSAGNPLSDEQVVLHAHGKQCGEDNQPATIKAMHRSTPR